MRGLWLGDDGPKYLPPLLASVPVRALRQRHNQLCMWHLSLCVSPHMSVCLAENMRGRKAPSLGSIPPLSAGSPLTPKGEATQQHLPAGKSLRDLMSVGPRWGPPALSSQPAVGRLRAAYGLVGLWSTSPLPFISHPLSLGLIPSSLC